MDIQSKKKILFVITKSNWGGAQRYVYDLATNISRERFQAVVAAGGGGPLFEKLLSAGIRTISIPKLQRDVLLGNEVVAFWNLLKIFWRERPNIIHFNSTKAGIAGSLAAFLFKLLTFDFKLVTVFTAHGWGFNEDRSHLTRTAIFLASWFSGLFLDKIITIDSADFRVAQRFVGHKKVTLIFNGIQSPFFLTRDEARSYFVKMLNIIIPFNTILIGTIAELTKNKGLSYGIDALAQFKKNYRGSTSIVWVIIGEGEERKKLTQQIRQRGLEMSIFLVGFIPDASQYLHAFDIFVLPSIKEGLPYVILEAMSAGCAILATDVGGIPDAITPQKTGLLVPPKNPQSLARAFDELIRNPQKRGTLGINAKIGVATKFSFRNMIEKTIHAYSSGHK